LFEVNLIATNSEIKARKNKFLPYL